MLWLGTKKNVLMAEAALAQTHGMLAGLSVGDLDLERLAHSLNWERSEGIYIGDVGQFAIVIRAHKVIGLVHLSGLGQYATQEPRCTFAVEVSTCHGGEYGPFFRCRVIKSFDSVHDLLQWLVGA